MDKQVADEPQFWQMFNNAHWPQQHTCMATISCPIHSRHQQINSEIYITMVKTSNERNKQRRAEKLPTEYKGSLPKTSITLTIK